MIKGVLFDLDGVIVETAQLHYLAWKALAKELGIEIDEAFNEQLKGVSREESLQRILNLEQVQLSESAFAAAAAQKNTHYLELVEALTPQDILPGITDFLQALKASGIKLALASASKNGPLILEKLNLLDTFDYIADPATVPSKPDPGIFLLAAEGLGLSTNECVGIEDAQAGVQAIHDAGMPAIGIGAILIDAEITLDNTNELTVALVKSLVK